LSVSIEKYNGKVDQETDDCHDSETRDLTMKTANYWEVTLLARRTVLQ